VSGGHAAGKKAMMVFMDNDTNGNSNSFPSATSPANVDNLVSNMVALVNQYNLDGVDIDWEANINTSQYTTFIGKLRAALPAGKLISADVGNWSGIPNVMASSYANLDQINVMCYDMDRGQSGSFAWYDDALLQAGDSSKATCDWRVNSFTSLGVPKSKLGIGIPFYGRRWTGITGPMQTGGTQQGYITYANLVSDSTRWQPSYQQFDTTYISNYLSIPPLNEYISYNGSQFIQQTVQWAKAQGYGGFMAFTLTYEYLPSQTGDASHPLSTVLFSSVTAP
jgi:chitinase